MNPYYYGFFQDLECDVIEHWDTKGINVWKASSSSTSKFYVDQVIEYELEGWAKHVLSDADLCLVELGYMPGDYASWLANREQR